MSRFIGEIILFSGKIIPEGFMPCDGRMLEVSKYQALYSIILNAYGGDSKSFALPDLRSRAPIGLNIAARADGRSASHLGAFGGTEVAITTTTLKVENLPVHDHPLTGRVSANVNVSSENGTASIADGAYLARIPDPSDAFNNPQLNAYLPATNSSVVSTIGNLAGVSASHNLKIGYTGGAEPIEVKIPRDPYLTIRYLIAVGGGGDAEYPAQDSDLSDV